MDLDKEVQDIKHEFWKKKYSDQCPEDEFWGLMDFEIEELIEYILKRKDGDGR